MLKSSRVYLDALKLTDSETFFKWINDPELVQFNAPFRPVSESEHRAWFNNIQNNPQTTIFTIRLIENDFLIGSCQLMNQNKLASSAELQIRIGEWDYQNQGLGKEALTLLLNVGFNKLNLNRIFLHVFASNVRAQTVYQKLGFLQEGLLRQAAFINGCYEDVIVMALLNNDYKKILNNE